jgi:hypothetical protein
MDAQNILEPIKRLPIEQRGAGYAAAQEKLIPDLVEAGVDVEKQKSARDIGVREAASKEAQRQTGLQEEEYAKGRETLAKYELPTFKPTKEDLSSYAQLGSMIGTLGLMLGNSGKSSSRMAINSMSGMLNGWRQGRKDLYEKESKAFDQEFKRIGAIRKDIQNDIENAMKMWATKRKDAVALAETAAYKAGTDSVLGTMIRQGRFKEVRDLLESNRKVDEKALETKARLDARKEEMAQRERQHRETMKQRAERQTQTGQQRATQQQFIVQRSVNALGGVASALESIVNLPEGATTGWLQNLQTKDGMFNAVRNQLGRKISQVDAEMMNTLFSGIGRNLASIEASGTATGLTGLANQLQSGVYINAGVDDPYKVAIKLADIRRIASENIRPSIDSGLMPKQQAETAQKLVDRIEKIIPYTTVDVVNAYKQAKRPSSQTVGGAAAKAVQPSSEWSDEDEKRLQELERKQRGS